MLEQDLGHHEVTMIDVGQGDCIAIQLRTGEVFLIDSNMRATDPTPPAIAVLERYARGRSSHKYDIDLVCLSHPDLDHYRGMVSILEWAQSKGGRIRRLVRYPGPLARLGQHIQSVLYPALSPLEQERLRPKWKELDDLVIWIARARQTLGNDYVLAAGPRELWTIGGVDIRLLGPPSRYVDYYIEEFLENAAFALMSIGDEERLKVAEKWVNDISCVLSMDFGETQALFAGDASELVLRTALESTRKAGTSAPSFAIVKAAHHGARDSSSQELWREHLIPVGNVLISAGHHRGYRHPHTEMLDDVRLACSESKLWCTNRCFDERLAPNWDAAMDAFVVGVVDAPSTKYHGTCRFLINGASIDVVPEQAHGALRCPYH